MTQTPVPPAVAADTGVHRATLLTLGDRVLPEAPAYDADRITPQSAVAQYGYGATHVGVVPVSRRKRALVVTHDVPDARTPLPVALAQAGMSIVTLKQQDAHVGWRVLKPSKAPLNRRIHGDTRCKVTGPAAGDLLLRTAADPGGTRIRGVLACGPGATTPWQTVLTGEGDVTAVFGRDDAAGSRFDPASEPQEAHRFGWVVEIDPTRPLSKPRKHTMLGRLAHRGCSVEVSRNGRLVVHLGDDRPDGCLYRFVSRDRVIGIDSVRARKHNSKLLRRGTLFVAGLVGSTDAAEGVGEWIPLASDTTSYVEGMGVAEVLVHTREAARRAGGSSLGRPTPSGPRSHEEGITLVLDNGRLLDIAPDRDERASRTFVWERMRTCEPAVPAAVWQLDDCCTLHPIEGARPGLGIACR